MNGAKYFGFKKYSVLETFDLDLQIYEGDILNHPPHTLAVQF